MRAITTILGPYVAGVANGISTAQTLAGGGNFALNGSLTSGGVATLDNARQVAITSAGNDSNIWFNIQGVDANSDPIGEEVRGANVGTVTTNTLFKKVNLVSASGPTSSVTIGSAAAPFTSPAIRLDEWGLPPIGLAVAVTGAVIFTIQHSFDEGPDSLSNPIPLSAMMWDSSLIPPGGVGGSANVTLNLPVAPLWLRIQFTGTGSLRMVTTQYSVVGV
jgi:Tfp pilus assembly major pilin PilA